MKSLIISKNFVKQESMIKSSIASCYRVKTENEFFALSTCNGFLPSWYKKPEDPLWGLLLWTGSVSLLSPKQLE